MLLFLVHDYFRKDQGKRALLLCRLSRFYQRKIKQETGKKNRKEMRIVFWPVTHLLVWNERKNLRFTARPGTVSLPCHCRAGLGNGSKGLCQISYNGMLQKSIIANCVIYVTRIKWILWKQRHWSISAHVSGRTRQTRFSHDAIAWQDAWQLVLQGSNFLESKIEMFENQAKKCYCSMACPSL